MISATSVDVVLNGIPIVRSATMAVQRGEVVAIIGNNGSGKTTLMRALLGLVPHSGEVELFGVRLQDFRQHNLLGYVPQRSSILVQQATARGGGRRTAGAAASVRAGVGCRQAGHRRRPWTGRPGRPGPLPLRPALGWPAAARPDRAGHRRRAPASCCGTSRWPALTTSPRNCSPTSPAAWSRRAAPW
ncbi:MAG: ATP-binding cassette domain-containing protein [Ardenticatenia bacterium]|nr:ATP-binding cassette domain-containing protein [Ardenticatenia bacterium]